MPSEIPCCSAIETAHVHYMLFFSQSLQSFEVCSPIFISRSCFSLLAELSTSRDSIDLPVFSPTTLEESHHYCADKISRLVM